MKIKQNQWASQRREKEETRREIRRDRMRLLLCATHRSSQVNELLSHLDYEVVFGHERTVQALIKLYQFTMHLSHLKHTHTGRKLELIKPWTTLLQDTIMYSVKSFKHHCRSQKTKNLLSVYMKITQKANTLQLRHNG